MAKIKDLHRVWSKAPAYRGAYDVLDDEFRLAGAGDRTRLSITFEPEGLRAKKPMKRRKAS
jgi:hypothetical protein